MQNLAKALRPGDTIGIIAPASPPRSDERIEKSVRYFERLGYRVELGKHIRDTSGYLAGTDEDRAADLNAMFRSKHVRAIFYHRGGFGSIRLLDKIDYDLVIRNPKIVVGYSDATALLAALYKKAGLYSCFFGPMPGVDLWDKIDPFTEENLWRALTPSRKPKLTLTSSGLLMNPKSVNQLTYGGRMIGGNLTVFTSLFGTSYQPTLKSTIPLIEEIDEKPRKIDAYLAQLRLSGVFERASAILLGQFTNCNTDKDGPTLSLDEVFEDYFSKLKIPVITNLPFGHEKRMWTIPFGAKLRIDANSEHPKISIIERVLI
jgi:muramoyltetrapeptide carboxypeptidase